MLCPKKAKRPSFWFDMHRDTSSRAQSTIVGIDDRRGSGEPLRSSIPTMVDWAREEVSRCMSNQKDGRFAFFGHSMGALVAFELARKMRYGQGPDHLFVAGHRA